MNKLPGGKWAWFDTRLSLRSENSIRKYNTPERGWGSQRRLQKITIDLINYRKKTENFKSIYISTPDKASEVLQNWGNLDATLL